MCPYIYTLIMKHEKTFEYFGWGVETYAISMCYMLIVFHKMRGFMVVSDEACFGRTFGLSFWLFHLKE